MKSRKLLSPCVQITPDVNGVRAERLETRKTAAAEPPHVLFEFVYIQSAAVTDAQISVFRIRPCASWMKFERQIWNLNFFLNFFFLFFFEIF